jgi:hypothetical protein
MGLKPLKEGTEEMSFYLSYEDTARSPAFYQPGREPSPEPNCVNS